MNRLPEELQGQLLDAYIVAIPIIIMNVIWFVVSLPLVTFFPAVIALFYTTNQLVHGKTAGWHLFFEAFRKYFWLGMRWGVLNIVVLAILITNLIFYARLTGDWVVWVRGAFLALTIFWLILQTLVVPLLLEQEKPAIRQAFMNSLVILARRPLYTLWHSFVIGLVAVLSTLVIGPAWIFISGGLIAYLANRSTLTSIRAIVPARESDPDSQPE